MSILGGISKSLGGILGDTGGAVGTVMGGPIGGVTGKFLGGLLGGQGLNFGNHIGGLLPAFGTDNVFNAVSNVFGKVSSQGFQQATNTLAQQHGLPKFIADAATKAVNDVVAKHSKPVPQELEQTMGTEINGHMEKASNDIADQVVQIVSNQIEEMKNKAVEKSGKGKVGAKSWLMVIAEAMGKVIGQKAADMVKYSTQMGELVDQKIGKNDQSGAQQQAKEMQEINMKFQAASQEFNILSNAFSTAIKALGEGDAKIASRT